MTDNNKKPNFFLLGAPKCGTTSMAEYLSGHPNICMSDPKEPSFFNTDYNNTAREFLTESGYEKECFNHCGDEKKIGEASTVYLYSEEAVANILSYNESAQFIVMVRNPLEMAPSLHAQRVVGLEESEESFREAWRLREKRKKGRAIPSHCRDVKRLLYGEICKTGKQIEQLLDQVPRHQAHIIIFDDFVADTKEVYENTLDFLNVRSDNRDKFPALNTNQGISSSSVHRFNQFMYGVVYPRVKFISDTLKQILNINKWGLIGWLRNTNKKKKSRSQLSGNMRQELIEYFADDVEKLSRVLNRDLSDWLQNSGKE